MWPFRKKVKPKTKTKSDAEVAVEAVLKYPNASFEGRVATAYGMVKKRNPQMYDHQILMAVAEAFSGK